MSKLEIPVNVYLKRHTITGMLYFGKTIKIDVEKYKGSGKLWRFHCNKHGWNFIENVFVYTFTDKSLLEEFCLAFSEIYDIVESTNFSNLVPENGLDGGDRTHMNFIDKVGNIFYLPKTTFKTNNVGDDFVKVQSNEGRRRLGVNIIHKNSGTIPIYDILSKTTYRELTTVVKSNPDRYIHISKNEYRNIANLPVLDKRNNKQIQVVSLDGIKYSVTKEEYLRGNHISTNSKHGKQLLNISLDGNRKNTVTCRDVFGDIITIAKIDYWKQLEKFGEDRNLWDYVHPTHPIGKQRKLLRG